MVGLDAAVVAGFTSSTPGAGIVREYAIPLMAIEDLRRSPMMGHMLDALDDGEDIGHYGRLVFVMIGRHFLGNGELVELLTKDHDADEGEIRALVRQVEEKGYSPPRREKILEFQNQQDFPIRTTPTHATCTTSCSSPTRSTKASRSTRKRDKPPKHELLTFLIRRDRSFVGCCATSYLLQSNRPRAVTSLEAVSHPVTLAT